VFGHADPSGMEITPRHPRSQCRLTEAARSRREPENAWRQPAARASHMPRSQLPRGLG
jgi:hypothetical protein